MKLSIQFPELGTMLMKQLLKCPGEKERMRRPVVNVATVELIYQLGKKQDPSYQDRCGTMSHYCIHHPNEKDIIQSVTQATGEK